MFIVCKDPENCNNDTAQVRFGLYSMAIANINGLFTGLCSEPLNNMSFTSEQSSDKRIGRDRTRVVREMCFLCIISMVKSKRIYMYNYNVGISSCASQPQLRRHMSVRGLDDSETLGEINIVKVCRARYVLPGGFDRVCITEANVMFYLRSPVDRKA